MASINGRRVDFMIGVVGVLLWRQVASGTKSMRRGWRERIVSLQRGSEVVNPELRCPMNKDKGCELDTVAVLF